MFRTLSAALIYCLLVVSVSRAQSAPYQYPIANRYAATVLGTPVEHQAKVSKKVRRQVFKIRMFKERRAPKVFWYEDKLRFSLAYQRHQAPLIFNIAGTGASFQSAKMRLMERAFFQAGFHVISLSSPTFSNFIVNGSRRSVPGLAHVDAEDLYEVMMRAYAYAKSVKRIEVSEFYLTGYSLGAAQAAFISLLDEEKHYFDFKKVLMINPPVSLYDSVARLDSMFQQSFPNPGDVSAYLDRFMNVLAEQYREEDFLDLSEDYLYRVYRKRRPDDSKLISLIAFSFRLSAANMVFSSDVMTRSGYIVPKNLTLSSTDSLTDFFKVSVQVSFVDYFNELLYPHFRRLWPGTRPELLREGSSLSSIEPYLRRSTKIALVTNADDIILSAAEVEYLQDVFGPRAKVYPRGGHCGNMAYRDNVAFMVNFFKQ